jgi:hypothetical protein
MLASKRLKKRRKIFCSTDETLPSASLSLLSWKMTFPVSPVLQADLLAVVVYVPPPVASRFPAVGSSNSYDFSKRPGGTSKDVSSPISRFASR